MNNSNENNFDEILKKRDRSWMEGGTILEHLRTKYAKNKVLRSVDLSEASISPEEKYEIGRVWNTRELGLVNSDIEKQFNLENGLWENISVELGSTKFTSVKCLGEGPVSLTNQTMKD